MLIGIDVAKAELVVGSRPDGHRWTVANDERGVRSLVERLREETPELIVLEATGGYELLCGTPVSKTLSTCTCADIVPTTIGTANQPAIIFRNIQSELSTFDRAP